MGEERLLSDGLNMDLLWAIIILPKLRADVLSC